MSKNIMTLFRNVPPALALALAQTESHEKAHRRNVMEQNGVSELEAATLIAQEINDKRKKHRGL